GDGRQLDRLRDDGAPRQSDQRAPSAHASLEELTPYAGGRVFVGRDAEGSDEVLSAEATSESHHVHLTVPKREPDDVPHDDHGRPPAHDFGLGSARPEGGGAAVTGRAAPDQRSISGTASIPPLLVARR